MSGQGIDDHARTLLHERLQESRAQVVAKLEGLDEYAVRRPMTSTGTNLLGLVTHLALYEAAYFGTVFGRPFAEQPVPALDGVFRNRDHLWVPAEQSRAAVVEAYRRACRHADETITSLPVDASGHVPWWESDVTLFDVLVHMLCETDRHLGHADLLRESLDGAVGDETGPPTQEQAADRAAHRARVEAAAVVARERAAPA